MSERTVVIGGASGGWGDSPSAVPQLLRERPDYLMMDYLAEVTMSLLARARQKAPELGYVPDFISFMSPWLSQLRGTKVVTNAGGTNPIGCRAALEKACKESGVDLKIAVVVGDDVLPLMANPTRLSASLDDIAPDRLISANAYLGAWPIAAALRAGADVVITGWGPLSPNSNGVRMSSTSLPPAACSGTSSSADRMRQEASLPTGPRSPAGTTLAIPWPGAGRTACSKSTSLPEPAVWSIVR